MIMDWMGIMRKIIRIKEIKVFEEFWGIINVDIEIIIKDGKRVVERKLVF